VPEISDDSFQVVDNVGDKFLVMTNRKAPNNRLALYDPANKISLDRCDSRKAGNIAGRGNRGGKIFATYMKDVASRVSVYSLSGQVENEIALPGVGTTAGLGKP